MSRQNGSTYVDVHHVTEKELEQFLGSDICVSMKSGRVFCGKLFCYKFKSFLVLNEGNIALMKNAPSL